ncbi:hypothetical protein, partial [Limosilactobacillus panis]|uniref:hypothetical protein n=1 Tax=Limosilactobacillus panis TaxID=47493 RepID=UPI001F23ADD2
RKAEADAAPASFRAFKFQLGNQIFDKLLLRCHFHGVRQRFAKIWVPIIKPDLFIKIHKIPIKHMFHT